MKAKILQALQTKFAGVDAKTLERIADKLVSKVAEEKDIDNAVSGVTIQQLMDSYKDAAVTAGVQTAISNYEQKYGIKDGKPVQQQQQQQTAQQQEVTDPNIAALTELIKQQSEQIKTLQENVTGIQQKSIGEQRLAKLNGILKDAPEAYRNNTINAFGLMQFNDDAAFDTYAEGVKTTAEALAAAAKAQGGIFNPPAGGGGGNKPIVNAYVQARANERAAAYNGGAIQGLPQQPAQQPTAAAGGNN